MRRNIARRELALTDEFKIIDRARRNQTLKALLTYNLMSQMSTE